MSESNEDAIWIKVVPATGYPYESRSMAENAAEMLATALHAIDYRGHAEVLTWEEIQNA